MLGTVQLLDTRHMKKTTSIFYGVYLKKTYNSVEIHFSDNKCVCMLRSCKQVYKLLEFVSVNRLAD
jgi:hypothetical protein